MSSREFPVRPLVGVGAAIVDGAGDSARVLLARRGRAPSLGEWSIPGGLVKVGETLEQALIREVREETGLHVRVVKMIEVLDRIIYEHPDANDSAAPASQRRVQYHYVIIDYVCRLEEDALPAQAQASSDATALHWATREELSQFNLRPALLRVIEKCFD